MKKLLTICLMTAIIPMHTMAQKKTVTLRIVETSDVHGCFFPYDFVEGTELKGTLARVSSYVNNLRKEYGKNVILLDNGDILQGQPVCYYSNYVKTDSKNIAAEVINYMQYDAQTFGNHDVETGHDVYDKWIRDVNCPMLGANIIDKTTGTPYVAPFSILNRDGVKVVVIGMVTPAIPNWLREPLWSGLRFDEMVSSAKYWMQYVQQYEQPDVIIGLFHSGWDGGIVTDAYSEDAAKMVAEQVPGFDLILYGHDHTPGNRIVMNKEGKAVTCLDPASNATRVADATITVTKEKGKVVDKTVKGTLVDMQDQPVDEDFVNHFKPFVDEVTQYVNRPIGYLAHSIYTRDCYFGSSAFTDLILNMQLDITGADIAFNAPLAFDACMKEGPITVADMFKLYKYENKLYVMMLTGEEIRKHLEMSYDLWANTMTSPKDHLLQLSEKTFNDQQRLGFKNFSFNFDSAAGIDYEVDVTKPDGQKVRILQMSNGQPFDEQKWYRVAINSYRGNGGGELLTKGAGIPQDSLTSRIVWESERDQRYYLMQEIEKTKFLDPKPNNNWKFVPEDWTVPAAEADRLLLFGVNSTPQPSTLNSQPSSLPNREGRGGSFTPIFKLPITSIKDQNRSGTCWDYATIAFFEAEILRQTGKEYNLCEMFVANKNYMDCAVYHVRMHGDSRFSQGGSCDDVLEVIKQHGICPEEAMPAPGTLTGDSLANFNEFFSVLEPYIEAVAKSKEKKLSSQWKEGYQKILDAYLGKCPDTFSYKGKTYTPQSFAASLGLDWNDYVSISSFTHHPFYEYFAIEAPYKWRWSLTYNVPMQEMMDIIDQAVKAGYPVAWGGDVSEKGFDRKGMAVLDKKDIVPTQELRQQRFDSWQSTYDHVMLIYGIAKDQDGKEYYMVKNSWGEYGDYKGTWYMSKDYIALNTTYIFLNKKAVKTNKQ